MTATGVHVAGLWRNLCLALVTLAVLFGSGEAEAQQVSPVIVEYRGGALSGSFDLTNDSLQPLVVTIEPKSFSIDASGKGEFRGLDPKIHVAFSERSLRLPPKSRRTVTYRASADVYPAWFSVYAMFHGLPKQNGVNVQLELPHTVYLLGDRKQSKVHNEDLRFSGVRMEGGVLKGQVQNVSARMVRVLTLDAVQKGHAKSEAGGFPLLPGGAHEFAAKLGDADRVTELVARFGENGANSLKFLVGPQPGLHGLEGRSNGQ